jgi:hypothetical protein
LRKITFRRRTIGIESKGGEAILVWNIASRDYESMKAIPITTPAFREILLSPMLLVDHLQRQETPRFKMSAI